MCLLRCKGDDFNTVYTLTGEFKSAAIGLGQFTASAGYGRGACSAMDLFGISLQQ